jgi:hypothetical protein
MKEEREMNEVNVMSSLYHVSQFVPGLCYVLILRRRISSNTRAPSDLLVARLAS